MSVHASSNVVSRIDKVPAKLVCSGLNPTFYEQRRARGRPLERRADERFVDNGVYAKRQMRAVLLDGRDRQQADRSLRVDAAEIGRCEVLPVTAAHRRKALFCLRRPSCRVAGSGVNLG
jgi:hypothetical protein